jgi:hypothetical protein
LGEKSKFPLGISPQAKENAQKKISVGLGQIDLFNDLEKEVKLNLINGSFNKFQNEKPQYIDDVLKERELRPRNSRTTIGRVSNTFIGGLGYIPNDTPITRQGSSVIKTGKEDEFDLSNYVISHDTIFVYKDIGEAFYNLLKEEMNPEPWEFLQDVEKYENSKIVKEKIKLLKEIYLTYIDDNAEKPVNISAVTKNHFIEKITPQLSVDDNWILEEPIDEIFDETKRIVKAEMIVDVFPRFPKSSYCSGILAKYKNNTKVLLPKLVLKNSYNNDFVLDKIITDADIDYFKRALEDSFDYEILSWNSSKIITTLFGTNNYIPKVTLVDDVAVYKYDAVVPYPLEHVVCSLALLNNRVKYDADCKSVTELEYIPFGEFNELVKEKHDYSLVEPRGISIVEIDFLFKDDARMMKNSAAMTAFYDDSTESYYVFSRPVICQLFHQSGEEELDWKKTISMNLNGKPVKYSLYFSITLQVYQKIEGGKTHFRHFHSNSRIFF